MEAYTEPYTTYSGRYGEWVIVDICGGRDIFGDIFGHIIDPEVVIERNPDIIIKKVKGADAGYEYDADDTSKIEAIREELMNRPELAEVAAVKNGKVYAIDGSDLSYGPDYPIAMAYWAKWFQPDLFDDLNPKAIHQEYLMEFQGFDYDLDKHGVFVYPEPS